MTLTHALVLILAIFIIKRWVFFFHRKSKYNLNGKNILITGGTSGIGIALASCMLEKRPAHLIIWGRNNRQLNDTQASLEKDLEYSRKSHGPAPRIWVQVVDVTDTVAVQHAADEILRHLDRIDVVVNNAGIVCGKSLVCGDLNEEDCILTMNTNAIAHIRLVRVFLPSMKRAREGYFVSILSTMSFGYASRLSDYCGSKWAALAFLHCLRFELKSAGYPNIKTLGVCPFLTDTELFDGALENDGDTLIRQLFFPKLKSQDVADQIVRSIEHGEEILVIPRFLKYCYTTMSFLPIYIQDFITATCGGHKGMKNFRGKRSS